MSATAAPIDSDALVAQLHDLGIADRDVVMVHASLRAVGPVVGGAAGLISALDRAVGPDGTLLMTLGARDDWSWVNQRPEHDRPALLADAEPFDARRTPAEPEVGVLAEVFRTTAGTVVNDHPEGRFAARGARAAELVDEPPWHDYYGPGSPLERLVHIGGKVLRLGASPDTVTLIHYAEYLTAVPHKRRVTRHRRVVGPHGAQIRIIECLDDSEGIVEWQGEDYFGLITRAALAAGLARTGRVGHAESELFDAVALVRFATTWMDEHLVR